MELSPRLYVDHFWCAAETVARRRPDCLIMQERACGNTLVGEGAHLPVQTCGFALSYCKARVKATLTMNYRVSRHLLLTLDDNFLEGHQVRG